MAQMEPRRDAQPNLDERLRALEDRVRELQEREARRPRALLERMLPAEARQHIKAAQRERLLAMRAMVDAALKRTEENPAERPRRAESVRID